MTKSKYADRDTIGTIALNAAKLNERVQVGDMARELMPQLVDDLNNAIASNPFNDRPFYITLHEKKDLQLKNVLLRRPILTEYRPYPEENTQVYWTDPKTNETLFCWCLPHRTEFPNILENAAHYSKEYIKDIYAYCVERLDHFGFYKAGETEDKTPIYYPIPGFKDRKLRGK
jgi:hypothetical protein